MEIVKTRNPRRLRGGKTTLIKPACERDQPVMHYTAIERLLVWKSSIGGRVPVEEPSTDRVRASKPPASDMEPLEPDDGDSHDSDASSSSALCSEAGWHLPFVLQ